MFLAKPIIWKIMVLIFTWSQWSKICTSQNQPKYYKLNDIVKEDASINTEPDYNNNIQTDVNDLKYVKFLALSEFNDQFKNEFGDLINGDAYHT